MKKVEIWILAILIVAALVGAKMFLGEKIIIQEINNTPKVILPNQASILGEKANRVYKYRIIIANSGMDIMKYIQANKDDAVIVSFSRGEKHIQIFTNEKGGYK